MLGLYPISSTPISANPDLLTIIIDAGIEIILGISSPLSLVLSTANNLSIDLNSKRSFSKVLNTSRNINIDLNISDQSMRFEE